MANFNKRAKHVEVLVSYTKPEVWKAVNHTKTATQYNRFADADYIAFLRVERKDGKGNKLPSAITHIAKVKSIGYERSSKEWLEKNPLLLELSEREGKGWGEGENMTHKQYYLEEIMELPKPVLYDGKPKSQVCFYTTLEELNKAEVLSDIKTISQLEQEKNKGIF